jgi:hypothetical protein
MFGKDVLDAVADHHLARSSRHRERSCIDVRHAVERVRNDDAVLHVFEDGAVGDGSQLEELPAHESP